VGQLLARTRTSDVVDAHVVITAVHLGHDILSPATPTTSRLSAQRWGPHRPPCTPGPEEGLRVEGVSIDSLINELAARLPQRSGPTRRRKLGIVGLGASTSNFCRVKAALYATEARGRLRSRLFDQYRSEHQVVAFGLDAL